MSAFRNTSHFSDQRGQRALEDYGQALSHYYDELAQFAETEEKKLVLDQEFTRFRNKYREFYIDWLQAESRCASWFVTGPANFPVERMKKKRTWAENKWALMMDFRKRAINAIEKTLRPELRPIMAGDSNAVERLKEKLAEAEAFHDLAKKINSAIRQNVKGGREAQKAALLGLGLSELQAAEYLTPNVFDLMGVPKYSLTNNNANIRRMKSRLMVIQRDQAKAPTEALGTNARFEDSPSENRVKIFFPGKPSEEIRARLKSKGFRWTPSKGCWQAYRHAWTVATAKEIAGVAENAS